MKQQLSPARMRFESRGYAPREAYLDGMSRLGAAVNIITTDGPSGRAGFTASAVCSVTDTPPTLLVCLKHTASVYAAINGNGVLCVNILAGRHKAISKLFGGKTPTGERFAAADWSVGETGAPILEDAVASFDCRIENKTSVGTHDVLFCEVLGVRLGASCEGLVYFDRSYHVVPTLRSEL
jgi:flavin reductase